jgi:hypothetical protein
MERFVAGPFLLAKERGKLAPGLVTVSACLADIVPDIWAIEWAKIDERERLARAAHEGRVRALNRVVADRVLDMLLAAAPFLAGLGLAALFATIALGFEEPNRTMLVVSSCLLLAAPLAVLVHVTLTSHLTQARRRTWLRALRGPSAISAFSRYLRLRERPGFLERRHPNWRRSTADVPSNNERTRPARATEPRR